MNDEYSHINKQTYLYVCTLCRLKTTTIIKRKQNRKTFIFFVCVRACVRDNGGCIQSMKANRYNEKKWKPSTYTFFVCVCDSSGGRIQSEKDITAI